MCDKNTKKKNDSKDVVRCTWGAVLGSPLLAASDANASSPPLRACSVSG